MFSFGSIKYNVNSELAGTEYICYFLFNAQLMVTRGNNVVVV